MKITSLKIFNYSGKDLPVAFIETTKVTEGVECDVYRFIGDNTKDLGIIRIEAGRKTPLQKVLKGNRTIEGFVSGRGKLEITKPSGERENHDAKVGLAVEVKIGELMQWQADPESELKVYEICFPPFKNGRFENL